MKAKVPRLLPLVALGAAILLGGCGGGGSGSSSGLTDETTAPTASEASPPAAGGGGSAPSEAESAATGDIPDNQTFLVFSDAAAGYSIRYPEGWARKGSGNDVTFREKANVIHLSVRPGSARSKPGEKVTVTRQSAADPVTGKRLPLTVDVYEYERGGKVAVLELSTPVGVDNVDAYRLISESFPVAVESLYREPELEGGPRRWPALEMRDVFKIYRSGPVETVALRGVDLEVDAGEVVAILGPSGCGKSTLLALAAGLDRASAGDVRSFGSSLALQSEAELAEYRANSVGIVFQSSNLWPTLTARENVLAVLRLGRVDSPASRADAALAELGLDKRAGHRTSALSGGEQQRVAIAAAVARQAPLILADEPTGELDAENQQVVLSALRRLPEKHGCAVVVVTHSGLVAGAADRVVELRDGARVR